MKKRLAIDIRVSFIDNQFYLAAFYNKNSFEPNIQKSVLEYENIADDMVIFDSLIQIGDDLRLNEEFWLTTPNVEESDYEKGMLSLV